MQLPKDTCTEPGGEDRTRKHVCPKKKNNRKKTKGVKRKRVNHLEFNKLFLFEKIFGGKNTEKVTGNGKQKQIMIKVRKKAMD